MSRRFVIASPLAGLPLPGIGAGGHVAAAPWIHQRRLLTMMTMMRPVVDVEFDGGNSFCRWRWFASHSRRAPPASGSIRNCSTGSSSPPAAFAVPPGLLESLQLLVPHDTYVPVTDVYAALAAEERNIVRKSPFKQLGRLLATLPSEYDVTHDKLMVRRVAASAVIAGAGSVQVKPMEPVNLKQATTTTATAAQPAQPKKEKAKAPVLQQPAAAPGKLRLISPEEARGRTNPPKKRTEPRSIPLQQPLPDGTQPPTLVLNNDGIDPADDEAAARQATVVVEPAQVNTLPPPPLDTLPSPAASKRAGAASEDAALDAMIARAKGEGGGAAAQATADDVTLSAQMVAGYIPPYFVPIAEVVALMPEGYTESHIEQLFAGTNTLQIVNVLDAKFVRFLGAHRNHCLVDLLKDDGAIQIRAAFVAYRPNPEHLTPFLRMLEPRGEWKSLYQVVTGIPDAEKHAAALPYHGPQSLLYFAQMQHVVAFSAANGGGLCVPMRRADSLGWDSSPTLVSCHAVWRVLEGNPTELEVLWAALPEEVKEELTLYFGDTSVIARQAAAVGLSQQRGWGQAPDGSDPIPKPAAHVAPLDDETDLAQQNGEGDDRPFYTAASLPTVKPSAERGWAAAAAAETPSTPPQEQQTSEPTGAGANEDVEDGTGVGRGALGDEAEPAEVAETAEEFENDSASSQQQRDAEEKEEMRRAARAAEDSEGESEGELSSPAANDDASTALEQQPNDATAATGEMMTAEGDEEEDGLDEFGAPLPQGSSNDGAKNTNRSDDERPDTPAEATLRRFVTTHGALFTLRQNSRLALVTYEVNAYERQNMTLEEQLNVALERRNNTLAKKLKRKMAVLAAPDNPLLDEKNLAQAIADFLPPDRPLPWRALKFVLPADVQDLIPIKRGKKFFESYPELFKVFEVFHAGRKVIQRGHLPPPDGCLRGESAFTEPELLRIVANELVRRPRSVSGLTQRLPMAVERRLQHEWGGAAQFCMAYPQHFALVLKDSNKKDLRTAFVTLIDLPPMPNEAADSPELMTPEDREAALVAEDREADETYGGRKSKKKSGDNDDLDDDTTPRGRPPPPTRQASHRWTSAAATGGDAP